VNWFVGEVFGGGKETDTVSWGGDIMGVGKYRILDLKAQMMETRKRSGQAMRDGAKTGDSLQGGLSFPTQEKRGVNPAREKDNGES